METHPFGIFVPLKAKYLILGSFTAKSLATDPDYDWYYTTKRNQFWPILENVYKTNLKTKSEKQDLFTNLRIAIGDIIESCERKLGNSSDMNLTHITYNTIDIEKTLKENKIEKIIFSSRYVEKEFRKHFKKVIDEFPEIELVTLPSPSPRYAQMTLGQKIDKYKELLPKF